MATPTQYGEALQGRYIKSLTIHPTLTDREQPDALRDQNGEQMVNINEGFGADPYVWLLVQYTYNRAEAAVGWQVTREAQPRQHGQALFTVAIGPAAHHGSVYLDPIRRNPASHPPMQPIRQVRLIRGRGRLNQEVDKHWIAGHTKNINEYRINGDPLYLVWGTHDRPANVGDPPLQLGQPVLRTAQVAHPGEARDPIVLFEPEDGPSRV